MLTRTLLTPYRQDDNYLRAYESGVNDPSGRWARNLGPADKNVNTALFLGYPLWERRHSVLLQ